MKAIFAGTALELDTYSLYAGAPEPARTYLGNAQSKARSLRGQLLQAGIRSAVLADDSGLEVAALGGRPGVRSARYGGSDTTWPARRKQLLEELASTPAGKRSAKFCCAMVLVLEGGEELQGYGEVEGVVTRAERGTFGFGFDPIFWYAPANRSFAELTDGEKNRISHRAHAAAALLRELRAHG